MFGLIMTLTFTLGAGIIIEDEGREGARNCSSRDRLQHRLGCHRRRPVPGRPTIQSIAAAAAGIAVRRAADRRAACAGCANWTAPGERHDGTRARFVVPPDREQLRTPTRSVQPLTKSDVLGGHELLVSLPHERAGGHSVPAHRRGASCAARVECRSTSRSCSSPATGGRATRSTNPGSSAWDFWSAVPRWSWWRLRSADERGGAFCGSSFSRDARRHNRRSPLVLGARGYGAIAVTYCGVFVLRRHWRYCSPPFTSTPWVSCKPREAPVPVAKCLEIADIRPIPGARAFPGHHHRDAGRIGHDAGRHDPICNLIQPTRSIWLRTRRRYASAGTISGTGRLEKACCRWRI